MARLYGPAHPIAPTLQAGNKMMLFHSILRAGAVAALAMLVLPTASGEEAEKVFPPSAFRSGQGSKMVTMPIGERSLEMLEVSPWKVRTGNLLSLPVPAMSPGRYEIEVALAGRDHVDSILNPVTSLYFELVEERIARRIRQPVLCGHADKDGLHRLRFPFEIVGATGPFSVNLGWDTHGPLPEAPGAVRVSGITIRRLSVDPFVFDVRVERISYRPGETARAKARVINPLPSVWEGELVWQQESGFSNPVEIARLPLKLEPGATSEQSQEFPVGDVPFGHAVRATLQSKGTPVHGKADVFSVAENLWDVALGANNNGLLASTGRYGAQAPQLIADHIASMRDRYCNWYEMSFWAPDDWGNLNPTEAEWMSGQGARWQTAKWIKLLNESAHKEGIKAITYGKGIAGGPSAWELLRKSPQLFLRKTTGVWGGSPDVWDFDHWGDPEFHQKEAKKFSSVWHRIFPDLKRMDALDYGIQQLIDSSREFHWDGVRFDGHFTAGDDNVSTRNMRYLKERLWKEFPDYVFGFNMCSIFDRGATIPHEEREAMAGGGHWMQEGIGALNYQADNCYKSWKHFAQNEWEAARRVRNMGGTYHFIYRLSGDAAARFYKFAIGSLIGAHPVYGEHEQAPGSPNWGRFLTRWGAIWWHPNLRPIQPAEMGITVKGVGENVAWDFWARRIPISPDQEVVAIPFLALPDTETTATHAFPPPVGGTRMELSKKLRKRVINALWVTPSEMEARPLAITKTGSIELPAIDPMGVVILTLKGSPDYQPISRPRFTEPVDPAALARSLESGVNRVVVDPLRPELNQVADDPFAPVVKVHCAGVSWSMNRTVVEDPDAETGRAAGGDSQLPRFTTGGYFPDILPGKYRVTARIRKLPAGLPLKFSANIYENAKEGSKWVARKGSMRSKTFDLKNADGGYQEVVLTEDYQHHGLGLATVFVYGGVDPKAEKMPQILVDWVKIERLETYTDAALASMIGLPDQVVAGVGARDQILWVRGLYDSFLGLPAALESAFPGGAVEKVYQRDWQPSEGTLSKFGTIILPNIPPGTLGMAGRKALRDWVLSGGHLVIFGGHLTLGQGGMKGTYFEEVLPVEVLPAADVTSLEPGVALTGTKEAGETLGQIYYIHQTKPLGQAKILLWAGASPVGLRIEAGKGSCTVFAGTVMGAEADNPQAFWNQPTWKKFLPSLLALE
ncbi:MAG: hypothetical protein ACOYM3_11915 [Terrimicrobiaceae bacterium]